MVCACDLDFGNWIYMCSCCKVNLHPSLKSRTELYRFFSRISLYLAPSSFPSTLTSFPVLAAEKHDAATTMFHCGDGVLWVMWWVCARQSFLWWLKSSILFSSDQSTLLNTFSLPHAFSQTQNVHFCFLLKVMAFFWPLCHTAQLYGAYGLLSSYVQILQSPPRITLGLCAASLINALLARSVRFGGRPSLGRFAVVPCSFHLVMIWWCSWGSSKIWIFFLFFFYK